MVAREKLFSLINSVNPTLPEPLTEESLYFGKPKLDLSGKTLLPCVAVLGSGYEGYVTFDYQRINLSTAYGDIVPEVAMVGATTLHDMLPLVNQIFGLDLTKEDVQDVDITAVSAGSQVFIRVAATAVSPGYTGYFTFKFTRLRPQFSVVIAAVGLNTLKHYKDPADGLKSLEMQMYDFDFTPYKPYLATNYGQWRNIAGLRDVLQSYGFSSWPQAVLFTLTGGSTKNYPYANQKYDNVIVQTNVTIDGFKGIGLFHFNNVLA
jgi:hypothetical protein